VDQDNDGALETHAFDTDGDSVLDTVVTDANFNGVDDRAESAGDPVSQLIQDIGAGTVVGPATDRDPVSQLILDLAEETGQATFGTPDRDHDGRDDNEVPPTDPFYR
jgi:hypothetical protein